MKAIRNFGLLYILLVIIQILITNYCRFSTLTTVSILPVMILCLPLSVGTIPAMFIAFATGLATDWLSEGILGLNALALVPVAAVRKPVILLFLGKDLIERQEPISIQKNGLAKIFGAIVVLQAVFLAVYIMADGAGVRPFWFNAARFAVSLAAGAVLSMIVAVTSLVPSGKK